MEQKLRRRALLVLFPLAENIHLAKDVGMIPYILHVEYNYDSTLACYNNGQYPYLETVCKGLKLKFIKRISRSDTFNSVCFLFKHGRRYDVLQMYHLSISTLLLLMFFKCVNIGRQVKTYLKLDANDQILSFQPSGLKAVVYGCLFKCTDVISIELKKHYSYLEKRVKNLFLVPNGFNLEKPDKGVSFETKKQEILTVARLDDDIKAIPIIVKGFNSYIELNPHSTWTLKLVGPYNYKFKQWFDDYLIEHPRISDKVRLLGPIFDRNVLEKEYARSKIFILSSLSEGFPLVYLEALKHGCYIVSTPLTAAFDVTDNGKFGSFFEINNHFQLAEVLNIVCNDEFLRGATKGICEFARKNFQWSLILRNIAKRLQDNSNNA